MNAGNKMIWTIILLVLAVGTMTVSTMAWLNTRKMCKAAMPKNAPVEPEYENEDEPAE